MASQQILIRETILGMTRKLAQEKEGRHNSDNEAPSATNRQNKLKRRAEYYHFGELGGRIPYKRKIEHAGYNRYILKYNPRRYDEDGYELESDDEDSDADREAEEKNPYAGIKVEETLGPLTHVKNLQNHPAMSRPYLSNALPSMINDTLEMVHKERKTLVEVKHLLEPLRGDQAWIPAGALERADDTMLFGTEVRGDGLFAVPDLRPFQEDEGTGESAQTNGAIDGTSDVVKKEKQEEQPHAEAGDRADSRKEGAANGSLTAEKDEEMTDAPAAGAVDTANEATTESKAGADDAEQADASMNDAPAAGATTDPSDTLNVPKSSNPPTPSAISSPSDSPPRMLTRGRLAATNGTPNPNGSRSASPSGAAGVSSRSSSPPPLHPLYLTAQNAVPDRDLGLPPGEAEDLRRLLTAYAQKQEEVCRGADKLHRGLLKARRLRDTVWWWARAEEHCGELSDGEDWVDLEEWRLDAPLRKGNETGVDEAAAEEQAALGIAALGGKKTRGRRVAA